MNKVVLMGRLTKDPVVNYTSGDNSIAIARYTLAVDRRGAKKDGQPTADFISCVAFGKTAEFVEKYLKKGAKMNIVGHIQTGSYTNKDGAKVYTTDVVVDEHYFCESSGGNKGAGNNATTAAIDPGDAFLNVPEGVDAELPF